MRVLFTGAQGTGKTTIITSLPDTITKIQGITRSVVQKNGFQFNDGATDESQRAIFDTKKKALEETPEFVSERSLIDVLSYTWYQSQYGKCSAEEFARQYSETLNFIKNHPDDVYVYFPIEFELVADGTRSLDSQYQKEIDKCIKILLDTFHVKYITMTGSVENRLKILKNVVNF